MNQRRIAISGASGLIGSALCESLVADGWQVSRLDRNLRGASAADGTIAWNPAQGVVDPGELEGFDAIVHLAGRSIGSARWTDAEKMKLRDSRVLATERLAAQIVGLRQPPLVFVGASAVGIYGDCGQEIVDETATAAKDFLGRLAHDWEKASEPIVSEGIRVVHARFGVVLSDAGGALQKMLPLFRWGLGGRLGNGRQFMSWIDLEDCVSALRMLIEVPSMAGAYNLVSPNPVQNSQFTNELATALQRPAWLPAPAWALRALLGEMADGLLLASLRAVPARLLDTDFRFKFSELSECLAHQLRLNNAR